MKIPRSHPRYNSLKTRELIVEGIRGGITSIDGLIAHGRGEVFDYLLGEKTTKSAMKSIEAAAAMLLTAKHPVVSVNGNTAALVPTDISELAKIIPAKLEVNIFHTSKNREVKIKNHLIQNGAKEVLLPQKNVKINFLESNRRYVNKTGIYGADVVFVPLEDGDRTEALIKNGKKVIVVDLNPLSRSAQKSTITIVDNITRAVQILNKTIKEYKEYDNDRIKKMIKGYDNKMVLKEALKQINKVLSEK